MKKREHLDSSKQPKTGWRAIPQNSYFEANINGMIRNRLTKKLIKGCRTRRNHPSYVSHEIVYFLQPKKTSYSRALLIASTFPELISQSRGDIRTGYVCFKDGDRTNCHVDNMFIGSGKIRNKIYRLNNSYLTRKDVLEYFYNITGYKSILKHIEEMALNNITQKVLPNEYVIYKDGNIYQIFGLENKGMIEFKLDIDVIRTERERTTKDKQVQKG